MRCLLFFAFVGVTFGAPLALGFEERNMDGTKTYEKPAGSAPKYSQADEPVEDAEEFVPSEERAATDRTTRPTRSEDVSMFDDITISGGLGIGTGFFSANLTVGYFITPYFAIDTSGYFFNQEGDDYEFTHFGPEVAGKVLVPNPTIFTPFAGAGPGFDSWSRNYKGEEYDSNNSITTVYFFGLDVALTRNFGLQVIRRTRSYIQDPPLKYEDQKTPEERTRSSVSAAFVLRI